MSNYQEGYNDGHRGLPYRSGDYGAYLTGQQHLQQENARIAQAFSNWSPGDSDALFAAIGFLLYTAMVAGGITWGYMELFEWAEEYYAIAVEEAVDPWGIQFLQSNGLLVSKTHTVFVSPAWLEKYRFNFKEVFFSIAILNFLLMIVSRRYARLGIGIAMLAILFSLLAFAGLWLYFWLGGTEPHWMR